jgi:hypothetical protein
MDDEFESLVIRVKADTAGFERDVSAIRGQLGGPLVAGANSAGRAIERALTGAARSGKFGFDDLRRMALGVLSDIAASAVRTNLASASGSGGGGLLGSLVGSAASILGAPGRATGGPVTAGRPYLVGERGPELFVPGSTGEVVGRGAPPRGAVTINVNVSTPREVTSDVMVKTGNQVARAVRLALARSE